MGLKSTVTFIIVLVTLAMYKHNEKQVERSSDYRCVLARSTSNCNYACSIVLVLLNSSPDSHTLMFHTLTYPYFVQKTRFFHDFNSCVTDRRTDGRTDRRTDRHTLL